MLRVQYTGERERTVGIDVVYPGELLQATPAMLAAWKAEYGDVFAVVGETIGRRGARAIVLEGSGAHVFGSLDEADAAAATADDAAKGKRGRGK